MGQILEKRGHRVAWIGHPTVLRKSLPQHHTVIPLEEEVNSTQMGLLHQNRNQRGLGAFQYLWEGVLIPLAYQTYPHLIQILKEDPPENSSSGTRSHEHSRWADTNRVASRLELDNRMSNHQDLPVERSVWDHMRQTSSSLLYHTSTDSRDESKPTVSISWTDSRR